MNRNPSQSRRKFKSKSTGSKQVAISTNQGAGFIVDPCNSRFPRADAYDNTVVSVIRSYETLAAITSSTTVPTFTATSFSVTNIGDFTSWATVFDQYRIKMIQVTLYPVSDGTVAASTNGAGILHSVIDFDDNNALTTLAGALNYSNVIVTTGDQTHVRCWEPHVAIAAYNSSVFGGYTNALAPWIDTASSNVAHFGLKTAWSPTSSASYSYTMIVRMHLQFRNSQ